MIPYATDACISPLLGSGSSGIVFDGLDLCAEWTIPACRNSFYGRNVWLVSDVRPMRQGSNLRSGRCRRDVSSSQAPLPWPADGSRQHDKWAWRMAGVAVRHHRRQPIIQASVHIQMSRASLDKRRYDSIRREASCRWRIFFSSVRYNPACLNTSSLLFGYPFKTQLFYCTLYTEWYLRWQHRCSVTSRELCSVYLL